VLSRPESPVAAGDEDGVDGAAFEQRGDGLTNGGRFLTQKMGLRHAKARLLGQRSHQTSTLVAVGGATVRSGHHGDAHVGWRGGIVFVLFDRHRALFIHRQA